MEEHWITWGIGFLAQGFFSARIIVQWVMSERAGRVLSPSIFWVLSIAGSCLLCLYGWLRNDFSIILGQPVTYYIYLWNLNMKSVWARIPRLLRLLLALTPVAAICIMAGEGHALADRFLHNSRIPSWLLLFGSAGQLLFTLRFVYQWQYSLRKKASRLPAGFWLISLVGSLSILTYGLIRHDAVLILGQSFGAVSYIRNLCLLKKET